MFGVDYFAKRLLNTLFFSYLCKKKEYGFNKEQTVYP